MVSIAYMDPGNYGTDIAAGAGFKYDLLWACWLASGMAMLLQYLSGKLGIVSGYSLPELVRKSLVKRSYVIPYWVAAEAAAAATDLAEYLGTVLGLNLFPSSVARKEMAFYRRRQVRYGLALDNRRLYTKLDWITWTATLTGSRVDFEALVAPVFDFLNATPHAVRKNAVDADRGQNQRQCSECAEKK